MMRAANDASQEAKIPVDKNVERLKQYEPGHGSLPTEEREAFSTRN
jgi:hypothetical protein